MKSRNANIIIVALLMIAMMAVMLIVLIEKAHEDFPKDITVDSDGETESILPVRDLTLHPTESREYNVNLFCLASGSYYIYLDYGETVDGGLKEFVDVTVSCGDDIIYEGGLAELLDTDIVLDFEGELRSKDEPPLVLSFKYEMPAAVGNEAQGTYSDFDINLKIKKS